MDSLNDISRRGALKAGAASVAAATLATAEASDRHLRGRAEHVIMLWLGGGAAQVDTFDPKRQSKDGSSDPGSAYASIPTAAGGVRICQHLARTAPLMDRATILRGTTHDVIDEHAAATYRMHTGRPVSGTVKYPSLGALVASMKGPSGEGPPYVLMGSPSAGRGPGFLGAEYAPLVVTSTAAGPSGLKRPARVSDDRAARRAALLEARQDEYLNATGDDRRVAGSVKLQRAGFRLAGPEFLSTFDLALEPADLREAYGGEFGQRCLLARRLVQSGARFVEVAFDLTFQNGTGWDTHRAKGQSKQFHLIDDLDRALSTLLSDLEAKGLLDQTLVLASTEFGRPAKFDGMGGRGHQSSAFSTMLAGGGLSHRGALGATDAMSKTVVEGAVTVPDLFATVLAAVGCDPHEELYDGARPVPATDGGRAVVELFG